VFQAVCIACEAMCDIRSTCEDCLGTGGSYSWCALDSPPVVKIGAVLTTLVGFILAAHFVHAVTFQSFDLIVNIYNVESMLSSGSLPFFGLSYQYLNITNCVMCSFMVMMGVVGYVGQLKHSPARISAYTISVALLFVFFLAMLIYCITSVPLVNAVIDSQVQEWCQPQLRRAFAQKIKCNLEPWSHTIAKTEDSECNEECEKRAETLRKLGGCAFLDRMCHDFLFHSVGKGECMAELDDGSKLLAPQVTSESHETEFQCCKQACNHHFACLGFHFLLGEQINGWHGAYHFKGQCSLIAPEALYIEGSSTKNVPEEVSVPTELPTLPPIVTLPPALTPPTPLPAGSSPGRPAAQPKVSRRLEEKGEEEEKEEKETSRRRRSKMRSSDAERLRAAKECGKHLQFTNTSGLQWNSSELVRIVGSNEEPHYICYSKFRPVAVEEILTQNYMTIVLSIVAVFVLALSTLTGCCYQYTLATRRRGPKGLPNMLKAMICPCCSRTSNRKQKLEIQESFTESSSDDESDGPLCGR